MNNLKSTYCTLTAGLSLTILPMMAQHSGNIERELAEVEAAIRASGASTLEEAQEKAKQELKELSHVNLNIAITGGGGAGKSTFVNVIRGVEDDAEEAAPTDVEECTKVPTKYPHPTMPNVNIWDLPGIGTTNFRADNYIRDVNFNAYDFFLILTSSRLKEHDIKLAEEIKKNNKKFYFVRTKVDQEVDSQRKRKKKSEEETVHYLRQVLAEKLKDMPSTRIFLVSSLEPNKFDFNELMHVLENDLPGSKRDALIQSLPVYSMEILDKKYNNFKRDITFQALASAAVGALPVPGLSTTFDIAATLAFLTACYYAFGLDQKTVKKVADRVGKPIPLEFQHSKLLKAIARKSVDSLYVELTTFVVLEGVEQALKFIPIVGSVAGAGLSLTSTLLALNKCLDELYDVAKKIVEMAEIK